MIAALDAIPDDLPEWIDPHLMTTRGWAPVSSRLCKTSTRRRFYDEDMFELARVPVWPMMKRWHGKRHLLLPARLARNAQRRASHLNSDAQERVLKTLTIQSQQALKLRRHQGDWRGDGRGPSDAANAAR